MTTESYTSKDGRVTVRSLTTDSNLWEVVAPCDVGDIVRKDLCPDPQLLADQVAEQLPKPRYYVDVTTLNACVRDRGRPDWLSAHSQDRHPDAVGAANREADWLNERAEQEAAALNARATWR